MRLRNSSSRRVPRKLWHTLAHAIGLGGRLPAADRDPIGMYSNPVLLVRVRAERGRHGPGDSTAFYSYGSLSIKPCERCTVGFLTWVYLHELHHAFVEQFHEPLWKPSSDLEALADDFADRAFRALGGRRGRHCGAFTLDATVPPKRLARYRAVARGLRACSRRQLKRQIATR